MAKTSDNLEYIFQCQICFENFEEEGDHIPRILPCSHTLCHHCTGRLIQGGKIVCPECREKHEAEKEVKSFPQNKYILTQIKKKSSPVKVYELGKCHEHGKELNLFCKETDCEKAVCRLCLKNHREHEITDIEDQEKEVLVNGLRKMKRCLDAKADIFFHAKDIIAKNGETALAQLRRKKEEVSKQIDKMMTEVEDQVKHECLQLDTDVAKIKSERGILDNLEKRFLQNEEMSYREIKNNQEKVEEIVTSISEDLCGEKSFGYPLLNGGNCPIVELTGNVTREETSISLDSSTNTTYVHPGNKFMFLFRFVKRA